MTRLLLFLILALSTFVSAQDNDRKLFSSDFLNKEQSIRSSVKSTPWRWGSFSVSPIIKLRNVGYDDNVLSVEDREQDDFLVVPELGLQTYLRINQNWIWANRATYNYLFYSELDELRGSEYELDSRVYGMFKRLFTEFGGTYRRSRERINSEVDERRFSDRTGVNGSVSYNPAPRAHVTVGFGFREVDYDETIGDEFSQDLANLERDQLAVHGQYLYKLRPTFWPSAKITRETFNFKSPANPRDDSTFTSLELGARNEFKTRRHYNFNVGVRRLEFTNSPELDTTAPVIQGEYDYKLTRKSELKVQASVDAQFSSTVEYNYYLSRRIGVSYAYNLSRHFKLGPVFTLGNNDYDKARVPVDVIRKDDIWSGGLRMERPLGRQLNWILTGAYQDRSSNVPGQSDNGFQIFSEFTYRVD